MINIVKSGKINTNNLGEDNIMKQNLRLSKSEKEIMDKFCAVSYTHLSKILLFFIMAVLIVIPYAYSFFLFKKGI